MEKGQMKKGVLEMCMLHIISRGDMYGYEMIETLRKKSDNVFELKAGSLYPLLHSLEEKEFLTSYQDDSSGKKRKYYQLTASGKKQVREKKKEWETYQKAVTNVLSFAGGVR